jgi:hypothetical protein
VRRLHGRRQVQVHLAFDISAGSLLRRELFLHFPTQVLFIMAPTGNASMFDQAALVRRQQLQGASGPMAIVKNGKVFGIACFACIGG